MASKANDINDTINILSKLDNGHDFINIASSKPIKLEKIVNLFKKKYRKPKIIYQKETTPTYIIDIKKFILK